jgi:heat shock protein HtpX
MDNLFSTHPATSNRIAALEQLATELAASGQGPEPLQFEEPADDESGSGPWSSGRARGKRETGSRGPWG